MRKIDLNSDLGESFGAYTIGDDAAMPDLVTTANIACGFQAGDPQRDPQPSTSSFCRKSVVGSTRSC
jgi:lactam utilization protein B